MVKQQSARKYLPKPPYNISLSRFAVRCNKDRVVTGNSTDDLVDPGGIDLYRNRRCKARFTANNDQIRASVKDINIAKRRMQRTARGCVHTGRLNDTQFVQIAGDAGLGGFESLFSKKFDKPILPRDAFRLNDLTERIVSFDLLRIHRQKCGNMRYITHNDAYMHSFPIRDDMSSPRS